VFLEIATLEVKPGCHEAFAQEMIKAVPLMERAKGCRRVRVYHSVEHPLRFRMLIEWETIEEHIAFRSNPDAAVFGDIQIRLVAAKDSDHSVSIYPV
jgi:heme-degrading monooxygenase HmoA